MFFTLGHIGHTMGKHARMMSVVWCLAAVVLYNVQPSSSQGTTLYMSISALNALKFA